MDRPATTRACVVVWLLCAMLVCLAVYSPHCDLCDGPEFVGSSSRQPLFHHQPPASPDRCNGACWCCIFQGLPGATPVIDLINTVSTHVSPESPSGVQGRRSLVFRPPRIRSPLSLSPPLSGCGHEDLRLTLETVHAYTRVHAHCGFPTPILVSARFRASLHWKTVRQSTSSR